MITTDNLVQESLFFLMPFVLMLIHYLIKQPDKQFDELVVATHGINPKIFISIGLFVTTVLLMLWFTPEQVVGNIHGWLTIGSLLALSFFIVYLLQPLFKAMKNTANIFKFLLKGNFWLIVLSITAVALLVLYWLQEVNVYVQAQFIFFLLGYSTLIVITSVLLNLPVSWQIVREQWRSYTVVVIDPIIIMGFAWILIKILLYIFSQLL